MEGMGETAALGYEGTWAAEWAFLFPQGHLKASLGGGWACGIARARGCADWGIWVSTRDIVEKEGYHPKSGAW